MKRLSLILLLIVLAMSALPGCKGKKLKTAPLADASDAAPDKNSCPGEGAQLQSDCLPLWPKLESVGYFTRIGKEEIATAKAGHSFVAVELLFEFPTTQENALPLPSIEKQVETLTVELVDGTDRKWSLSPEGERALVGLQEEGRLGVQDEGSRFRIVRVFELEAAATQSGLFLEVGGKGCDASLRFCLGRRRLALESKE